MQKTERERVEVRKRNASSRVAPKASRGGAYYGKSTAGADPPARNPGSTGARNGATVRPGAVPGGLPATRQYAGALPA